MAKHRSAEESGAIDGAEPAKAERSLQPTVGRTLHVNIGTEAAPRWRPAVVVEDWNGDGVVNVQVFTDGDNDREALHALGSVKRSSSPVPSVVWLTSIHEGVDSRCYRWPPRA